MLIDLHNDNILKLYLYHHNESGERLSFDISPKKILLSKKNGLPVKALFSAFCAYPLKEHDEILPILKDMVSCYNSDLNKSFDVFGKACSLKEMELINSVGKTAVFLALEGAYCIKEPEHIDELYQIGFRLITLTHNASSTWAGSCTEQDKGLMGNAPNIIKRMNQLGMIIDLAHASKRTILDVVKISNKPVVFSHGGVSALSNSIRAIDDETIKAIASKGGLIGITVYPEQLTRFTPKYNETYESFTESRNKLFNDTALIPKERLKNYCDLSYLKFPVPENIPNYEAMFNNIDYVVKLVGEDHVCIGSDYDGVPYSCKGIEDISKLHLLMELMQERSYSLTRIQKILSGNIIRLLTI